MEKELTEHDWVYVVHCAAVKDEEAARKEGPEFYRAYLSAVKEMEEDERNGIRCTYDVGYDLD